MPTPVPKKAAGRPTAPPQERGVPVYLSHSTGVYRALTRIKEQHTVERGNTSMQQVVMQLLSSHPVIRDLMQDDPACYTEETGVAPRQ